MTRSDITRPISIEDLFALPITNDPQMSPDGRRVACTVTTTDPEANAYHTRLWIIPTDGGPPLQLTTPQARDTCPRWSPDGLRLAFVSDRGGEKQVWAVPIDGGEARPLTAGKRAPSDLAWSPDGRSIAFAGKEPPHEAKDESDVRVISRLRYKQDGEGFWDGRWKHVFIIPAAGGEARRITRDDCDHLAPVWSPDGTRIAYVANPDPDSDLTNVTDIWTILVDGSGAPERITHGIGPALMPSWSPDGSRIAYIGHDNACWGATNWNVWVVPATGGVPICVGRESDRSAGHHLISDLRAHAASGGLTWTSDGRRLLFMAGDGGSTQIASVPAGGGPVRLETSGEHGLIGCSLDRTARWLACIESDPLSPGEVAVLDLAGGGPLRRLTDFAGPILHMLALSRPEPFRFAGLDGRMVEGWVMPPISALRPEWAALRPGPCPAILEIHGGPHLAYGNIFFHELQLLAAQGYGVVYMNPRGSQGYGEAFTAATRHDWGGGDYEDLMRGLDYVLDTFLWIDRSALGVAGGSYGGFMTNWIVGHTDRFRAAVTMRSISNAYSQWGTSDLAYMKGFWEYPGDPWEDPEFYLSRSPITYVRRMRTPMLIVHSENDFRCPMEQAEQLFVALKKQGTPALFVRFPGESHDLSRNGQPRHRAERLRHILTWFRTYLPAAATVTESAAIEPLGRGAPGADA
jgi:dipeptidyl aminopeptidase/acylaminoacyl peptidase